MIHNISRFIAALALLATAQGVWAQTDVSDADGLEYAFNDQDVSVINVTDNITGVGDFSLNRALTINLNGHTISGDYLHFNVLPGRSLTINGGGQDGSVGNIISGDADNYAINNVGTVTLSNVNITTNYDSAIWGEGTLNIGNNVSFNGWTEMPIITQNFNIIEDGNYSYDPGNPLANVVATVTVGGTPHYFENIDAALAYIVSHPDNDDFSVNDAGDEYTIHTATGWGVFCDLIADGESFSGKTVRLGDNITVTRIAGSGAGSDLTASDRPFCGTFDGGGNTLTFNYGESGTPADEDYIAPFRYVSGATIQHLRVTGDIYTQHVHAGGIIGLAYGSSTVTDCRSSVNIHSSINGDGTHGGIMACTWTGSETNITGCLFDGSIQSVGTNVTTTCCGGFVGWLNNTINVTNCLLTADLSTVGASDSYTFVRRGGTIQNSYYLTALGTAQGHATRTVAPAADVTIEAVALTGTATQYTVSGITAYSGGGLQRGQTLYYGSGDQLSLTLSNSAPAAPLGYQYAYTASAGTLSGTTLTMPDEDVTISAALAAIDWATVNLGTIGNPYMIYNKDQLLLLAHRVNGTNGETANTYEGKYFKLGADITFDPDDLTLDEGQSNYEAIGRDDGTYRYFCGKFDGANYTVSGIRIRKTGTDYTDSNQGLFGCIGSGADIYDVHLTDARIKGYDCVGGIVGYNDEGYISGCSVTDSYITANDKGNYGTICGSTINTYRLSNNYYHGCTVNGTAVTSGKGCNRADIAANHGALPAYAIVLGANITTPPGTFASQSEWLDTPPVDARLAPENGFTLAGNHYFASGYVFTPGSTLASGAAQGYTPRATLGGQLLNLYTPTVDPDPLAGTAIAQFTVNADCDGKTLASTEAIYSTGQPVTVAYVNADGTPGETSAIALDGHEAVDGYGVIKLAAGTYYVGTDIAFANQIQLNGNINLILADGKTMTLNGNTMGFNGGFNLTIYGQSLDDATAGTLRYNGTSHGIYVYSYEQHSGNVSITTTGSWMCGIMTNGTITLRGGNLTVTADGNHACAIYGNTHSILGGHLTATATGTDPTGILATASNGTITLGWSKPTDRITASSYSGTVQVAGGKKLHNGSTFLYGTLGDPAAALNGKTLRPAAAATYTTADGTAATADAILLDASDNSLPAGNYLATGTLNYTHGITLTGNVTLILADNCHMNVGTSGEGRFDGYAIDGYDSNTNTMYDLTITSEANGSGNGNGALSVYTTGDGHDAIFAGTLTINGGNITADTEGNGAHALIANDALTINGGTVSANATGSDADAIYANWRFNYSGGNVTATAPNANAIRANNSNYAFSWRTPADRITIGATGLYAPAGKTATFARLFTDGSGHIYTGTLAASVLSGFPAETTLQPCLALADAASNTAAITDHAGQTLAVALTGRTLYKDGSWNTLCLPFDATLTGDLANATLMELDTEGTYDNGKKTGLDGTTLNLYFKSATSISAGKPYIIKWANGSDITNPVFTGVTISKTVNNVTSVDGKVTFVGSFSPVNFEANDQSILFLGAENKLYWPNANMTLGACRAHFELSDGAGVREFKLNFGEGETTAVANSQLSTLHSQLSEWYTLDGRKLDKQPTKKGMYIHNGNKVVIK